MTNKISFDKVHACGNDFVLLDTPPTLGLLQGLCDRNHGIGADGVVTWHEEDNMIMMSHYDPDGSQSLCLNGTRASLVCLALQGKIPSKGIVITEDQKFPYEVKGDDIELVLPVRPYEELFWQRDDWNIIGFSCDVGNPHYILLDSLVPNLFPEVAPMIRHDEDIFPEGCNVHLVWDDFDWRIRSYERGVEGFTLACGSGMYAAALVVLGEEGGDEITFVPDGQGEVRFVRKGDKLIMSGGVRWVASGIYRC